MPGARFKVYGSPTLPPGTFLRRAGPLPGPLRGAGVQWHYRGSTAIWHGVGQLGLRAGEEILFPSYHCGSELDPIVCRGLAVRFYRIDRHLKIDVAALRRNIGPRTRAVFMIHYLGVPGAVDDLRDLCRTRGIFLLEDCAHGLLGTCNGRPLGTLGDLAFFSLKKSLPVPDGGALVANTLPLPPPPKNGGPPRSVTARTVKGMIERHLLRRGGTAGAALSRLTIDLVPGLTRPLRKRFLPRWYAAPLPFDANQDETRFQPGQAEWAQSAISRRLLPRLRHLRIAERRRRNYLLLIDGLREAAAVRPVIPDLPEGAVPWQMPVLVEDPAAFRDHLEARGVECGLFWNRPHRLTPAPHEDPDGAFLRRHLICLPVHQDLEPPDVEYLTEACREWRGRPPC